MNRRRVAPLVFLLGAVVGSVVGLGACWVAIPLLPLDPNTEAGFLIGSGVGVVISLGFASLGAWLGILGEERLLRRRIAPAFQASVETREQAATRRWQASNAAKPAVCHCGAPGTVQRAAPDGFVGSEPPKFWYCEEHQDVPLTVPWVGGKPLWKQTREECGWRHTYGGMVTDCGCGTHVGEQDRSWIG